MFTILRETDTSEIPSSDNTATLPNTEPMDQDVHVELEPEIHRDLQPIPTTKSKNTRLNEAFREIVLFSLLPGNLLTRTIPPITHTVATKQRVRKYEGAGTNPDNTKRAQKFPENMGIASRHQTREMQIEYKYECERFEASDLENLPYNPAFETEQNDYQRYKADFDRATSILHDELTKETDDSEKVLWAAQHTHLKNLRKKLCCSVNQ